MRIDSSVADSLSIETTVLRSSPCFKSHIALSTRSLVIACTPLVDVC